MQRKEKWYEKLQCKRESDHASHPAQRVCHCSSRCFYTLGGAVNTVGGSAPATGCAKSGDVGNKAFMPYTADYFFYFDPYADDRR